MTFFLGGHFEFFFSKKNKKNCFNSMKRPKAFIWGIIYFCTMDGFFRILEKTSSDLICTQDFFILFGNSFSFYVQIFKLWVVKLNLHVCNMCAKSTLKCVCNLLACCTFSGMKCAIALQNTFCCKNVT